MATVKVNNVELYYEDQGTGQVPLVILNGIMMSTASWAEVVPAFIRAGRRVITVDFRDQGRSQSSLEPYTITQHVADLKALLAHLKIDRFDLMGISYGGQVAMLYALAHQDAIRGLLLFNTSTRASTYLKAIGVAWTEAVQLRDGEKFFALAMPLIYSHYFYERKGEWLAERGRQFKPLLTEAVVQRYTRLFSSHGTYDISKKIHQINRPTLVVASGLDVITPYEEMLHIHHEIQGSYLVLFPETGHASCYEKPTEIIIQVLGFLQTLPE